jgi:hypothetical protein
MDPDGGSCSPSLATVATDAGYSGTTSVLDALAELEAGEWLLRDQRRRRDGSPATTSYHAALPSSAVDPADPGGPPVDPAPDHAINLRDSAVGGCEQRSRPGGQPGQGYPAYAGRGTTPRPARPCTGPCRNP